MDKYSARPTRSALRFPIFLVPALVIALLLSGNSTASAQPWVSAERVALLAHHLSEQADEFQHDVRKIRTYAWLAQDVANYARSAEHFHQMVERGTRFEHLMDDYYELERDYYQLRAAMFRAYSARERRDVAREWIQVVAAHEYLALAMGVHGVAPDRQTFRRYEHYDQEPHPYDRRHDRRYPERYPMPIR